MLGFAYLAATQTVPVADYVAGHPGAMWLVGPAFAALTGAGCGLAGGRAAGGCMVGGHQVAGFV